MPRELALYLTDIIQAGEDIRSYTADLTYEDYIENSLVRAGVERKFTIIGEALNQAVRYHPEVEGKISQQCNIVAFRNRIMHGYFSINDALLWSITRTELSGLIAEVQALHRGMES